MGMTRMDIVTAPTLTRRSIGGCAITGIEATMAGCVAAADGMKY